MPEDPRSLTQSIRSSQLVRVLLVGLLILVLQVPIVLIHGQIASRQSTRTEAVHEITSRWGGPQSLFGPVLRVPYHERQVHRNPDGSTREVRVQRHASFLPEELRVDGDAAAEVRYRGIFEVPVYRAHLELSGHFARPDFSGWGVRDEDVQWERARLLLAVADAHAIQNRPQVEWNEAAIAFEPGADSLAERTGLLHAPLADALSGDRFEFTLPLALNGAGQLHLQPAGKSSEVTLTSDWPDPSFQGSWLPVRREVDADGFTAHWAISDLGRNYPARWRDGEVNHARVSGSRFGVDFLAPVDPYRMAERSVKYQILFLVLTFLTLWLFEILTDVRVHPIQYLQVGAAMCLFYLLQLSLAEHLGFHTAYLLAAVAVVLLVAAYSRAVLGRASRSLVVGSVLAALYAYLFVLLQRQDYALLIGSIGLFAALALVMWLTRSVDWYGLEARVLDRETEPAR